MSKQAPIEKDFLLPDVKKGPKVYLQEIRDVVSKHSQKEIKLKIRRREKEEKYSFRVAPLAETLFKDEPEILEEWEEFYLPEHMFMAVIGVLQEFSCSCSDDDVVLMVCEDGKVFAYEENMLYLVSDSLNDMFTSGLTFPGSKQYYRGQSFSDMTDKDWDKVRKSKEVKKVREEHQAMLRSMEDSYLQNLDIIMGRTREEDIPAARGQEPVYVT